MKKELAIILPIYNPHVGWYDEFFQDLLKLEQLLHHISFELVLVNDGSTQDISKEIALLVSNFKFIRYLTYETNQGKGFAIRTGLKDISANHYIYSDWDFPFGENSILEFYLGLKNENIDIVVANRSNEYYNALPLKRYYISKSLRLLGYFILQLNNHDTQAGLKALNEKSKQVFLETTLNSFLFELEFLKKIVERKYLIKTILVNPKESIVFTNFNKKTLYKEAKNILTLIFRG